MRYKNRKPKKFKGCCSMCACRDRDQGLRNKRLPTMQERRANDSAQQQLDKYSES